MTGADICSGADDFNFVAEFIFCTGEGVSDIPAFFGFIFSVRQIVNMQEAFCHIIQCHIHAKFDNTCNYAVKNSPIWACIYSAA